MVLHDNKWDRKAKRAYERKHGLTKPPPPKAVTQKWSRHTDTDQEEYEPQLAVHTCGAASKVLKPEDEHEETTRENGTQNEASTSEASALPTLETALEQFAIEQSNSEEDRLIQAHIDKLRAAKQVNTGGSVQKRALRENQHYTQDREQFETLASYADQTKLREKVKRRLGSAQALAVATKPHQQSLHRSKEDKEEEDFDSFMDTVELKVPSDKSSRRAENNSGLEIASSISESLEWTEHLL